MLVSTSIGEEGLDIGEVDMIICYDSQSSPVRMVSASHWRIYPRSETDPESDLVTTYGSYGETASRPLCNVDD